MTRGILFRCSVPPWAREHYQGQDRLVRRFETKEAGELWIAQTKAEIKALKSGGQLARLGIATKEDIVFRAASGLFLDEAEHRGTTQAWYRDFLKRTLNPRFGKTRVSLIGSAAVKRFKGERRREGATAHTIAREIQILWTVLAWARDEGHPVDASAWRVSLPEVRRQKAREYDEAAVERLLAATSGRPRAVLEVLARTGFRQGELRAFDCSWIRWSQKRILVPHDVEFSPKSKRTREIPMSDRLAGILKEWLAGRRTGRVFPPITPGWKRGKGWVRGTGLDVERLIAKASTDAGVEVAAHDLRHHFASWLAAIGFSLREIQEILGHASSRTTEKYIHAPKDHIERAVARMNRAESGSGTGSGGQKVVPLQKAGKRQ